MRFSDSNTNIKLSACNFSANYAAMVILYYNFIKNFCLPMSVFSMQSTIILIEYYCLKPKWKIVKLCEKNNHSYFYNQDGGLICFQNQNINISMINCNSVNNRASVVIFYNLTKQFLSK